jgi:hypothetical protein
MKKEKFGGLQKLRAGYMDGQLSIDGDIMKKYKDDFNFDNNDYIRKTSVFLRTLDALLTHLNRL